MIDGKMTNLMRIREVIQENSKEIIEISLSKRKEECLIKDDDF